MLEILFDSNVYFATATGGQVALRQVDLGLGPLASFSSGSVAVHYDDNHSTFSSQDEIIVQARDEEEYRATLEGISGADYGTWLAETYAPGDPAPNKYFSPCPFCDLDGVTLPDAQSLPFPDTSSGTPTQDWPMAQAMFTGSPNMGFDLAAGQFGGSIKSMTLLHRGVCSRETPLQPAIDQILKSVSPVDDQGIAVTYLRNFQLASFLSRDNLATPTGGLSLGLYAWTYWNILLGATSNASANYTYLWSLYEGILNFSWAQNIFAYPGADPFGQGHGKLQDLLEVRLPQSVFLTALENQSLPIPSLSATAGGVSCGPNSSGQINSSCFVPCNLTSLGSNAATDPSKWPKPLDASDYGMHGQEETWYDQDYCRGAAAIAAGAAFDGAEAYSADAKADASNISSTIEAVSPYDDSRFANVRCNFYPTNEVPTIDTGNKDKSGNEIFIGVPRCELVIRAKRVNVLPDTVELVFFDGPSLSAVGSDEFANEAFAAFLAVNNFAPQLVPQLCNRKAETQPVTRRFAHGHVQY